MSDEEHFKMIDTYFKENTLVNHHISSVNQFYNEGLPKVFRDMNPIKYYSKFDDKLKKSFNYNKDTFYTESEWV